LLDQEVTEVAMDAGAGDSLDAAGWIEDAWRYARSSTIGSGTTEVHRLLAARALTSG
jgi:alkylation response protein AidB-like acyl-CoA dehydrogenase